MDNPNTPIGNLITKINNKLATIPFVDSNYTFGLASPMKLIELGVSYIYPAVYSNYTDNNYNYEYLTISSTRKWQSFFLVTKETPQIGKDYEFTNYRVALFIFLNLEKIDDIKLQSVDFTDEIVNEVVKTVFLNSDNIFLQDFKEIEVLPRHEDVMREFEVPSIVSEPKLPFSIARINFTANLINDCSV